MSRLRCRSRFWLVILGFCCALGCRESSPKKRVPRGAVQVTDDLGQRHVFPAPAQRIVSLSPALTEVLFAIGCGKRVVLRDGWSDYPRAARAVPKIEGLKPSAEAVLAARPDAVVASFPPSTLQAGLRGAKVPIVALNPVTLADVQATFGTLGTLCGATEAATELAQNFADEIASVRKAVAGKPRPRVFFELDAGADGQPYTLGKGAFGHELIEAAGGENVFAHGKSAWFQVSLEAVLTAKPDVVLLADALTHKSRHTPQTVAQRPGWNSLPAARKGRIHAVSADWTSRPGPRLVMGLRQVAGLLHPSAFGLAVPEAKPASEPAAAPLNHAATKAATP